MNRARRQAARQLISTAAASSTPNDAKPAEIWPQAMLNRVMAAVVAPIKNGIEMIPLTLWIRERRPR
jgi:hypothetical protein